MNIMSDRNEDIQSDNGLYTIIESKGANFELVSKEKYIAFPKL